MIAKSIAIHPALAKQMVASPFLMPYVSQAIDESR
jgi:hypothetical protein